MTRAGALAVVLALAGCATQPHPPHVGVYAGSGGRVTTSVASGVGPVSVGVNNHGGGYLGTSLGPVSLGAGF
ncbi:hypothetical protein D2T31_19520 [Sinirhodobacter populi]|uniref:Lipoprotein n=1 Tax=Paenirhodobacter populi TaxID=2306993 RepID=A0A443K1E3_9RHOB|nr:hypothetical protein [Sinirhodobacter populi]RWR26574.1 hypothetical protein D2T31_19520 [Sinirhodobacter populi]